MAGRGGGKKGRCKCEGQVSWDVPQVLMKSGRDPGFKARSSTFKPYSVICLLVNFRKSPSYLKPSFLVAKQGSAGFPVGVSLTIDEMVDHSTQM